MPMPCSVATYQVQASLLASGLSSAIAFPKKLQWRISLRPYQLQRRDRGGLSPHFLIEPYAAPVPIYTIYGVIRHLHALSTVAIQLLHVKGISPGNLMRRPANVGPRTIIPVRRREILPWRACLLYCSIHPREQPWPHAAEYSNGKGASHGIQAKTMLLYGLSECRSTTAFAREEGDIQ